MAKSKSRGARTGKRSRGGNKIGGRGYSKPASVDQSRSTGGSNGLRAQRAGRRIGQVG